MPGLSMFGPGISSIEVAYRTSTAPPVGEFSVYLEADVAPSAGEYMMGAPTYDIYSSGNCIRSGPMTFNQTIGKWTATVTELLYPDVAKVTGKFMPAGGGGVTTVTDTQDIINAPGLAASVALAEKAHHVIDASAMPSQNTLVTVNVDNKQNTVDVGIATIFDKNIIPIDDPLELVWDPRDKLYKAQFKNTRDAKYFHVHVFFADNCDIQYQGNVK